MTIDHSRAEVRADPIELVAEIRHLVRAVLVAGDDFIDRVDDDCYIAFPASFLIASLWLVFVFFLNYVVVDVLANVRNKFDLPAL